MGELDPGVQTFIFDTLLNRLQRNMAKNEINPPECFILAAFYINSLGTDRNDKEAARLIRLAAYNGHQHAQAYACRICRALSTSFVPDDATVSNLCVSALKGSRTALKDLQQVAPDQVPYINTRLRNTLGGVGANFFHKDQMLHSLSHWAWTDMLTSRATIADKLRGVKNKVDFRINKRGDRMLHFAASCGYLEAVMALIEDYFIDVNQLNDQGETPLLCACRASQVEVTQYLINHGADVSISTADKESPMHWLVSFEGDDVTTIGLALHACGGNVRLITMRDIAHSVFPGGIDCDHQVPGTPLSWAVHHDRPDIVRFFLDIAADPSICLIKPPNRGPTDPLTWAAHYHHTECLKLMIDALTKANMVYTFGPLIEYATHSADVFSMMLRHGSNYQARLKQTFDYLLESSAHIIFSTGIGGFGSTLLYYAVAIDKPAVVDYLLSQSMQSMLAVNQVVTEQLALETGSDDQITFTPANLMTYSAKGKHATTRDISVTPVVPKPRSEPQTGAFISQHINQACGERRRTPILESVRLNSSPMFRVLLASGADPKAKARNPFVSNRLDWTALHIFAHEGHNTRLKLVDDLISLGVLVDGDASFAGITETPTTVAIQNNAFNLASRLLELGADINALSMSSGLVATKYPTTILGQIITFNARHSTPRLRYILSDCSASARIKFIVEPERQLSALHRAALANHYLFSISSDSASPLPLPRVDYDMATNRETMYELLQLFNTPEQLNLRCNIQGRTALHLAVEACNIGVVRELTSLREVDLEAVDEGGETPASLLRFMLLQPHDAWIGKMLMEMRSLLPFLKEKVNCETEGLSQLVEAKLGLN